MFVIRVRGILLEIQGNFHTHEHDLIPSNMLT